MYSLSNSILMFVANRVTEAMVDEDIFCFFRLLSLKQRQKRVFEVIRWFYERE